MVAYRILFLAGAVSALPLNINLGAYSPALVVGTIWAQIYAYCVLLSPARGLFVEHGFANMRQQVMVKLALEVTPMSTAL